MDKTNTVPFKFDPRKSFLINTDWHFIAIRYLVGVLMIAIYFWIAGGVIDLGIRLYHAMLDDWHLAAEKTIVHVVWILAALELVRTLQSYLQIGRVKVTFILDAALVVLIGELISLWYRSFSIREVVLSLSVVSLLVLLRIITVRFSPDSCD